MDKLNRIIEEIKKIPLGNWDVKAIETGYEAKVLYKTLNVILYCPSQISDITLYIENILLCNSQTLLPLFKDIYSFGRSKEVIKLQENKQPFIDKFYEIITK